MVIQAEFAFGLLVALAEHRKQRGTASTYELSSHLGTSPAIAEEHLTLMQQACLVAATSDGGWALARSLASFNLSDLYHVVKLPPVGGQLLDCD